MCKGIIGKRMKSGEIDLLASENFSEEVEAVQMLLRDV